MSALAGKPETPGPKVAALGATVTRPAGGVIGLDLHPEVARFMTASQRGAVSARVFAYRVNAQLDPHHPLPGLVDAQAYHRRQRNRVKRARHKGRSR